MVSFLFNVLRFDGNFIVFPTKVAASSSDANSDSAEMDTGKCDEMKTVSNADAVDVDAPVIRSLPPLDADSTITFRTFTNNGSDESSAALISLKVRTLQTYDSNHSSSHC